MGKIDWKRTALNFVVFSVLVYTIASAYFITTNKASFNEYKESNVEYELYKDANVLDVILVDIGANTYDVNRRKRNAKIAAAKSYATFAIECIIEDNY